jgi:hypothetical protein
VGVSATARYTARSIAPSCRNASAQRDAGPRRVSTRRASASPTVSCGLSAGRDIGRILRSEGRPQVRSVALARRVSAVVALAAVVAAKFQSSRDAAAFAQRQQGAGRNRRPQGWMEWVDTSFELRSGQPVEVGVDGEALLQTAAGRPVTIEP